MITFIDAHREIFFFFSIVLIAGIFTASFRSRARLKKIEKQFHLSRQRTERILDSISGCLLALDENWRLIHGEFPGKSLWELHPSWLKTDCYPQLQRVLAEKIALHFEFFDPERSLWHEIHATPWENGLSLHLHNVTSQKYAELQRETEYLITQILAVAPSFSKAVPKVLQAICDNFNWEIGVFWKIDPTLKKMACQEIWSRPAVHAPEFTEITRRSLFSPGVGLPGAVWEKVRPRWIADMSRIPNFPRGPYAVKEGLRGAFAFPVLLGDEVLGVLEFFSREIKEPDRGLLQMFDAVGNQIGQFIERKEAEEGLRLAYEEMERRVQERTAQLIQSNQALQTEILERKRVEKEVLEISQKEQRQFGLQLHDGLCQDLAGLLMLLKVLIQIMGKKGYGEVSELKKISELLNEAVGKARDMARGLFPVELEGTSLMRSLRELTLRTQNLLNVSCVFKCPEPILIEDNNTATHLYRIAQEGINNAVKHGHAQHIEVGLILEDGIITLFVKDDGVGVVKDLQNSKGIGLHIMKYRARMMDASLEWEVNSPRGISLKCRLKAPETENRQPLTLVGKETSM